MSGRLFQWRGPWRSTGWVLVALGGVGTVGWVAGWHWLVQPFLSRPPIRPFAAIGLLGLGCAALAQERGQRRAAIAIAVVPILIGYLALLQLAGFELRLLAPFAVPDLAPLRPGLINPQLLPLASAVGFVLGGVALMLTASRFRDETAATFAVGLFGSVIVALSLAILLSQVFGLSREVQFGALAGASPQVAVGLIVLGLCLTSVAWNRVWVPSAYPAWVPPGVGLASLVAVLFLWRALVQTQRDDHAALLRSVARATENQLSEAMARVDLTLGRIALLSMPGVVGTPTWTDYVQGVVLGEPGVTNIAWAAPGRPPRIVPPSADSLVLGAQLGMQLAGAWRSQAPDTVRHFALNDSEGSIAVAVPRCTPSGCEGFVVGLLRVDQMLRGISADSADGFHRRVIWRGRTLAGSRGGPPPDVGLFDRTLLPFDDMTWELLVWPTRELRARMPTGLPNLLLAFGLVMSGLVGLSLQLGRTLQANARAAEAARLRLVLGRAVDRAWSWDLPLHPRPGRIRASAMGQEVREGRWVELVHPDDRRQVEAMLNAHLQGLTPVYEARYRRRRESGEWQWLVDRGHVSERVADGSPAKMLGVSGDISEREREEQERESSELRFRAVFDSAHHVQVLLDREGRVLEANPAVLALLGLGGTLADFKETALHQAPWWPTADARDRIASATDRARSGDLVTLEVEAARPGSDGLILDFSIKPIRDAHGQVVQLLAEGLDITARRRAESQLREVETLTTMGRLAARVAHEINNPLAGIQNAFLLLRDAIPSDHPHHHYVGAMEREIGRIASVTRQLYETYRPETDGTGQAGVRTLIGDAVALLTQLNRPSQVQIQADLDQVPSEVPIPESVLRQSVYNLVQNAVEASPPGGKVTVKAEASNGEFVLRVRDQGPGIPPSIRPHLFQPFVSTKGRDSPTSGMGIGLSLVHRSVRAIGGSIEIVDPPDGGTEFVVRLPISGTPS